MDCANSKQCTSLKYKETSDSDVLATPALGGAMPVFDQNEGLFLYNPNINLVLGSLYQPLTFGVAADGKNFTMELARIQTRKVSTKKSIPIMMIVTL
jgi:hypothetical protein